MTMESVKALPARSAHGAPQPRAIWPAVPETLNDLGIPSSLVIDLVLRHLRTYGLASLSSLNRALKLSFPILETLFQQLRQQQLLDVKGMIGDDYSFSLTGGGRELAAERSEISHYAGPAPVSLQDYHRATKAQAARVRVSREGLRQALGDLVVSDSMLDQLGPALVSQQSLFLYGPTGNGKTSLAERLLRVYQDTIVMPYAIEVDGQILSLFDPVVHRRVEVDDDRLDPRWVVCRRPCITTGGELVWSMLEARFDEMAGVYASPLQMKANNGIHIIDDFGRQLISPRELLNRWIVPLDRRVDYLTLRYGVTFQIPFELMVVFSTNLDPGDLADEAFLRRIHNKIYVEAVDADSFDEIFARVTAARRIPVEEGCAEYLRELCLRHGSTGLRACYPVDICGILAAISDYENVPLEVTPEGLDRAVKLYFTQTREVRGE